MAEQLESKTLVFQGLLIVDYYYNVKEKNVLIYIWDVQRGNQPIHRATVLSSQRRKHLLSVYSKPRRDSSRSSEASL